MSDGAATVERVSTKPGRELTLHDRLSQLDFLGACKLLGPGGAALIRRGGQLEPDVLTPIPVSATRAVIRIKRVDVALWLADDRPRRLRWQCSRCESACEHIGAAFSAVLEDKIAAARRFFNNAVQEYNTGIQRFPAVLFAGMLGFTEKQFFDLGPDRQASAEAPQVKF